MRICNKDLSCNYKMLKNPLHYRITSAHSVVQKRCSTVHPFDFQPCWFRLICQPCLLFFPFSFSIFLCLLFRHPLSLPITAALMWVRTSRNHSDGSCGGEGDNRRHADRERKQRDRESPWEMTNPGWFDLFFLWKKQILTWGMPLEEHCRR